MIDRWLTFAGIAVLLLAWAGPLPALVPGSFAVHMTLHMTVVGIGVPLLAAGIGPLVASRGWLRSQVALPIAVSILDLVVVWGWHAPALHHASRTQPWALAAEQLSFALVSLLVWLVALSSTSETRRSAALADQQLGGVIMLAIGGVIYLAGGLMLMARVLQRQAVT